MVAGVDAFLGRCLLLDLETGREGRVNEVGAVFGDQVLHRKGIAAVAAVMKELDRFSVGAEFVLGHNLLGHDIPTLQGLAPSLSMLRLPIVDTLYLSPLAFPENPYHPLVKDYKAVRDSRSDPVADARLAARIFREEWAQFAAMSDPPALARLAVYRHCFASGALVEQAEVNGEGLAALFAALGAPAIDADELVDRLRTLWAGSACDSAVERLALAVGQQPLLRPVAAYVTAWLSVAGANSVVPPWVRHRFPAMRRFLDDLRDSPCNAPCCAWCGEAHSPVAHLRA